MLDTSSVGFPVVASTATEPAMSLTRSPVTLSNSRLVGVSMLHSLVGIPPVLPVGPSSTPNDISHFIKVKMYREMLTGEVTRWHRRRPGEPGLGRCAVGP